MESSKADAFTSNLKKPNSSKPTILIIDDDELVCKVVTDILSLYSEFVLRAFVDPSLALTEIKHYKYDLILTDVAMPKVSGIEILFTAKKYQPDTPVVIMSGYSESDQQIQYALKNGACCLLKKTLENPDEIIKKLKEILQYFRMKNKA